MKIRVGVSVDQSMRYAFRPLVQSAIDARRLIMKELGAIPKDVQGLFAASGRGQSQVFRGVVSEARAAAREQQRLAKQTADEEAKQARIAAREQKNETKRALGEMRREHAAYERDQRAAGRRMAQEAAREARTLDRFATRTSHRATRFLMPNMPILSFAGRAARGIVQGLDVDASIAGTFRRNVDLESASVQIANQARLVGQEHRPGEIANAVRATQKKYGTDQSDTVGALAQFQTLTGDAKLGMDVLDRLAERSVTTGAKLNDLAAAAGNIANNLGDVPNKADAVLKTLDAMTIMGAEGAVEIKDLATQTAKLAAAAGQFGGDAGTNIQKLTALAEITRSVGGAASAQQAATGIQSFVNTLSKPARVRAFEKAGIKLRDEHNQLLDPNEIIQQIVDKTGGNEEKWSAFVSDAAAKRVVRGFSNVYNKAGGGAAGDAAMEGLRKQYSATGLTDEQRKRSLADYEASTEAKAKKFQAALDETAREVQARLLPALERAEPAILSLLTALGDATKWALDNPGEAITAAIVASIARAGIESAFRGAIEAAIKGAVGGGLVRGGVAEVAGGAGGGIATVLATTATYLAFDQARKFQKQNGKTTTSAFLRDVKQLVPGFDKEGNFDSDELISSLLDFTPFGAANLIAHPGKLAAKLRGLGKGVMDVTRDLSYDRVDDNLNQEAKSADLTRRMKEAEEARKRPGAFSSDAITNMKSERAFGRSGEDLEGLKARILESDRQAAATQRRDQLQEKMAGDIAAIRTGTLKVEVTNPPDKPSDKVTAPGAST